jgi:cytochrome c
VRPALIFIGAASAALLLANVGARGAALPPQSRGEVLFENRCARCHGLTGDGGEGLAPALTGIIGRGVASRADFQYSNGLKARTGTWTAETVDEYIADPQAFAPGADMDVNSPDPVERDAIVTYLKTLR